MKTIQEYYKRSFASAKGNLGRRGDSYLSAIETEKLVDFYYSMYNLPLLSLVNNEAPQVIPDDPSSRYNSLNSVKVTIRFDVKKEEKADIVVKLDTPLAQESKEIIGHDDNGFFIRAELSPENAKQAVEYYKRTILEIVTQKNAEVERENEKLKQQLTQTITEKKSKIAAQKGILKQLAELIPLTKKEHPLSPVIPLAKKKKS